MPHANSTTSRPRAISPIASECTLPCSAVMIAASSSLRQLSSSRKAKSTCVRRASDVVPHARAAREAEAMTSAASASLASATRPVTWPVAGLVTSAQPVGEPVRRAPSAQCTMSIWSEELMRAILLARRRPGGCRIVGIGGRRSDIPSPARA